MPARVSTRPYHYARLVSAKLFIDAHFGEPINLALIADMAHFSRFHFIRLFKSIYKKRRISIW